MVNPIETLSYHWQYCLATRIEATCYSESETLNPNFERLIETREGEKWSVKDIHGSGSFCVAIRVVNILII